MLELKGKRERLGAYAFGALVLFGFGAVGASRLRQPGPVVIQGDVTPPSTETSPKSPEGKGAPVLAPSPEEVVVDVSGAVKKSGVLHLAVGSRVEDALKQAGVAADADLEAINLAAKLEDGTVVYVPHKNSQLNSQPVAETYVGGSTAPSKYSTAPASHPSGSTAHSSSGPKQPTGKVSLNTGSLEQLQTLPGIGPATAQKILDYRQEHGGFGSIEEVLAIKGIGEKKMEKLRPWLNL